MRAIHRPSRVVRAVDRRLSYLALSAALVGLCLGTMLGGLAGATFAISYMVGFAAILWIGRITDLAVPLNAFFAYLFLTLGVGLLLLVLSHGASILHPYTYAALLLGQWSIIGGAIVARSRGYVPSNDRVYTFADLTLGGGVIVGSLLLVLGLMATIAFFLNSGGIPILQGEAQRAVAMEGQGAVHRISYLSLEVGAMLLIIPLAVRRRHRPLGIAFVAIVLLSIINMGTGPRLPALRVDIAAGLAYLYARYGRPRGWQIAASGLVLLLLMAIGGQVRAEGTGSLDLGATVANASNRIAIDSYNLQRVLDNVPSRVEFMHGESFLIDLRTYLPGHQENLGTYLKQQFGIEFAGGGITPTLFGAFYLDWGYAGIVVGSALVAFLLSLLSRYLTMGRNSGFRLVVQVALALSLMGLVSSGVSSVLVSDTLPTLGTLLIAWAGLRVLAGLRRRSDPAEFAGMSGLDE